LDLLNINVDQLLFAAMEKYILFSMAASVKILHFLHPPMEGLQILD